MKARALTPDDVSALTALRLEGIRLFPHAFLLTEAEASAVPETATRGWIDSGDAFGVFLNDKLIGFAGLRGQTLTLTRHRASLGPFYVTSKQQGTAAADVLMDHLLDVARTRGATQMELWVAEANPRARAFYARHGFTATGHLPGAVLQDGSPRTDISMVCDLNAAPLVPGGDGMRQLGPGDWRMFRDIRLEMLRDAPLGFDSSHEVWAQKPPDEIIQWLRNIHLWAVVEDGQIVATAGWQRLQGSVTNHRGHVIAVYTQPKARGRGLSGKLLGKVAQQARAAGVLQLELDVAADNDPAIAVYKAAGYVVTGSIPNCLNHSGVIHDQFCMVCALTA